MDWFLYDRDLCHERVKGKGSLIDLILTNRKYSFKNTHTFETGRSDHYPVYTMLKTCFRKCEPKQLIYRDLKKLCFESLKNDLLKNMVTCKR